MAWLRRALGWFLVVVSGLVLSAIGLTALIETSRVDPRTKPTPLAAFLCFGAVFGIAPCFLGWVLLRKKSIPAPVDIAAIVVENLPPAQPARVEQPTELSVEAALNPADVTHLHYWIFRKNWSIRFISFGFAVGLLGVCIQWQTLHWTGWQNLLFPAAMIGFAIMPWLNARMAFLRFYAQSPSTHYTFSLTGFRSARVGLTVDSSWDSVRLCWETTQAFVFFVRPPARILYLPEPLDAAIIPKRCLHNPEDERRLRALLGSVLGERAVLR